MTDGPSAGLPSPGGASTTRPRPRWLQILISLAVITAILVVVELIDLAMNGRLDRNGIVSRRWSGLDGVLWSPFLHADWAHLFANLVPGLVLGFFVLLSGRAILVTVIVWLVSGLGVWLTGPSYAVTIGASGIVFGWLTFLIVRGLFSRDVWQVLGGAVIAVIYGGILWGVLPGGDGVSWQGHLFGAVGGVLAAWAVAKTSRDEAVPPAGGVGTGAIDTGGLH